MGATRAAQPHVIVVSYLAHSPFSPRGIRTRAIIEALERECSVELIAGPEMSATGVRPHAGRSVTRKALNFVHSSFLLDKFEPWSWRRFRSWHPDAAGALLIGFPFSPVVHAARRLRAARVPYLADVGDPWILTKAAGGVATRGIASVRAQRHERRLWASSSGAIVTTEGQRATLRALFPELPTLVRPNGFSPLDRTAMLETHARRADGVLRLAHFGDLYVARLDLGPFLAALARSGHWSGIELHQYGSDWTGRLAAQRDASVVVHSPQPWPEVVRTAQEYDLAVVVGNRDATQLPSKAVAYLQLPIPRLAIVEGGRRDALADYVAGKPGWATLAVADPDVAEKVRNHVSHRWRLDELAAPEAERWDRVSQEIVDFALAALAIRPTAGAVAAT